MVNETSNSKARWLKPALIALAVVAVGGLSWYAYKNPQLFRAALTGGGDQPTVTTTLYIPNNYAAGPGDTGKIEIKCGVPLTTFGSLDVTF